jgi:uncharacterized protein YjbI with pentapeptide repeats
MLSIIAKNMTQKSQRRYWMPWRTLGLIAVLAMAVVLTSGAEQVISAQEIFAKLESKEPVYYDSIRVLGDLDLKTLPDARVSSSFAITNSTLINASFEGVTFAKDAVFWGTSFGNASFDHASFLGQSDFANTSFGNASFSAASFDKPAVFNGALFRDNVSFEDAVFARDAFFNEARFLANADFNYSDFASYSYFAAVQFFGDALFSDVDFSGALDFSAAKVAGRANFFQSRFSSAGFSNAVFSGPAQFGLAGFSGLSSFGGAVFAEEAVFSLARFSDAAYFSGAEFQKDALFGLAKFQDIASFQNARFEGDLNFKGGSISTMLLDKAEFGKDSRIILNDTDFARFKAHWNEIEEHVVWDQGAYLALVNNISWPGYPVAMAFAPVMPWPGHFSPSWPSLCYSGEGTAFAAPPSSSMRTQRRTACPSASLCETPFSSAPWYFFPRGPSTFCPWAVTGILSFSRVFWAGCSWHSSW